ncbi:MAG: C25 family peptidase propeptide domain-containing protein, partial [Planctomycetota bacterium]
MLACAALAMAGPAAVAPAGAQARIISSDASRLVFELNLEGFHFEASPFLAGTERLEIPDFGTLSGEGEPRLPGRYYMVALPPEGRYSLRSTIVRSQPLGRHRLEPAPSAVAVRDGADFVTTREIYRIDDAVYGQKKYSIGVTDAGAGRVRHQRIVSLRVDPVAYDPATGETVLATIIRIEVSFDAAGRNRLDPGREDALRPVP